MIPGAVSLTRTGSSWLYNTNVDPLAEAGTPSDTEWAFGTLNNYASLPYQSFDSFRAQGHLSQVLLDGGPMVMHLMNEDIYLTVTFTNWPQGGGFFSYNRSTPAAVVAPPILSAPGVSNNQFSFNYSATPGLRYDVESSSNLFNWTPLVTNVAAGNTVFFTNAISGTPGFYRVGRLP